MDTKQDSNKLDVVIGGSRFTLVSDKSQEYSKRIAEYVDQHIQETKRANKRASAAMNTTLAAVNIANEYFETKRKLKELEDISKEALENYEPALEKVEALTKMNGKLEGDVSRLKDDLVNSLNTIGDMNKGYSALQEENEKMKTSLLEKEEQLSKLEKNLSLLQSEMTKLQKQFSSIRSKEIYDKKG